MMQIWWERVPNALSFINGIVDSLAQEKSILLQHSALMPWPIEFASLVRETVQQQNASKVFTDIDTTDDPGAYLLQAFCKPEKRAQYRPSKNYAQFLAESDDIILHERYLWVKINSLASLDAWTTFVSDYIKHRGKDNVCAVFILDWQGTVHVPRKKGIMLHAYDTCIGEYDRIVFSMLSVSRLNTSNLMKNYLAELLSNVLGDDIELYSECLQCPDSFSADPYETILDLISYSVRSDGTSFIFTKTQQEVIHSIWQAQIRTIYPLIEEFRESFVKKHASEIEAQLPITTLYGEQYTDPKDVELGTLAYLADNHNLPLSFEAYNQLKFFKNARNALSHLAILSLEDIQQVEQMMFS